MFFSWVLREGSTSSHEQVTLRGHQGSPARLIHSPVHSNHNNFTRQLKHQLSEINMNRRGRRSVRVPSSRQCSPAEVGSYPTGVAAWRQLPSRTHPPLAVVAPCGAVSTELTTRPLLIILARKRTRKLTYQRTVNLLRIESWECRGLRAKAGRIKRLLPAVTPRQRGLMGGTAQTR